MSKDKTPLELLHADINAYANRKGKKPTYWALNRDTWDRLIAFLTELRARDDRYLPPKAEPPYCNQAYIIIYGVEVFPKPRPDERLPIP